MNRTFFMLIILCIVCKLHAQIPKAPIVSEGEGPYTQLIFRGVTLINGTGSPPFGPVDVVVEGNRIARVATVGYPGVAIDSARRPKLGPWGHLQSA